jgi:dTMP kinase
MTRGAFITLEGGEGVGKSTQLKLLAGWLERAGAEVVTLREPGGTPVGDRIRAVLLDPVHEGMEARAELLLYEASRAELVASVIRPALERGAFVICDRFADSSTAYQAYGRGLPLAEVLEMNRVATGGLEPDLTLILDLDPGEGLRRATATYGADRLEAEGAEFHRRVRAGFLTIAALDSGRCRVVDACGTPEEVAAALLEGALTLPAIAALSPEGAR